MDILDDENGEEISSMGDLVRDFARRTGDDVIFADSDTGIVVEMMMKSRHTPAIEMLAAMIVLVARDVADQTGITLAEALKEVGRELNEGVARKLEEEA